MRRVLTGLGGVGIAVALVLVGTTLVAGPSAPVVGRSICSDRAPTQGEESGPVSVDRDSAAPIWADEFDDPAAAAVDPLRWLVETGGLGWGEGELQAYTDSPANVGVDGGELVITARREPGAGGAAYTSARINTCGTFEFTNGRVEARIRLPKGQGLWPAFWLLGAQQPWPQYGEIDILESVNDMAVVDFNTHQPLSDGTDWEKSSSSPVHPSGSWANDYHVFAVDWTAGAVEWSVDGVTYARTTRSDTPEGGGWVLDDSPQVIVLNVAVGGYAGAPTADTSFPAQMRVDYVRVYANADSTVTRRLAGP